MPQVYSTLSTGVDYTLFERSGGIDTVLKKVSIAGGAGVAKKTNGGIITPDGSVVTVISEDDLAALEENVTFKAHEKAGFIRVVGGNRKADTAKVAKDMNGRDGSAPLDDQDFKPGGRAAGAKLGKVE